MPNTAEPLKPDPSMIMASKKDLMEVSEKLDELLSLARNKSVQDLFRAEEWVSTAEAKRILNISSGSTLTNWWKRGMINGRKKGPALWEWDVRSVRKKITAPSEV